MFLYLGTEPPASIMTCMTAENVASQLPSREPLAVNSPQRFHRLPPQ
jgi:hypothetical protein